MTDDTAKKNGRVALVACRVMEPELERLRQNHNHFSVHYLDQGLHNTPQSMPDQIQARVNQAAETADRIVLGYGLCSNGIVGVTGGEKDLIVPRCHDCIAFFLGSAEAYKAGFETRPGTYYLTPGWLAERGDPLSEIEDKYEPRYGRETAEWAKKEELKNYTHIVLVDTGVAEIEPLRKRAQENADFFDMQYIEVEGRDLEYFVKLVQGPYTDDKFIRLMPGESVTQRMFF